MDRRQVAELHYITPLANLPSIRQHGLLSHDIAQQLPHQSVAMEEIQDIRRAKQVPGGLWLHQYVNLYLHARNAMMYKLTAIGVRNLVVVRVSHMVMDIPGAVITDGNSANGITRFFMSPDGLCNLNAAFVFARSWNHSDQWEKLERKRIRCAEVLIPHHVPVEYITGIIAVDNQQAMVCSSLGWSLEVNADVFFQ